jgi:hypothetical protein
VGSNCSDPRGLRRAQPLDQALPATLRWIDTLPPEIQPLATLRDYPRIANQMARTWIDPAEFESYLYTLIVDSRRGRRGFPGDVHCELLGLREYCEGRYPWAP